MHANAPLTPEGRLRLCHRIASGWSITATAESMQVSRQTASKWWGRFVGEGIAGLRDRTSRPRHSPLKTPAALEHQILSLAACDRRSRGRAAE
jgi:transposase